MLERQSTAEHINKIVNHPSIYPWICGRHTGPLDLTRVAANLDNHCLVHELGCVLFIKQQYGIYEFHTSVLPEGRGRLVIECGREAFRYMFTQTDAFELMTKCPYSNVATKAAAKILGCTTMFSTRPIWLLHGKLVPVDVYSITIQEWVKQDETLVGVGKLFHDKLQEKYHILGKMDPTHEEDEAHNRYVGATCEMLKNGQAKKAVSLYNRFAIMASYEPIKLVSYYPLIIDIFESKLRVEAGDFEVVSYGRGRWRDRGGL